MSGDQTVQVITALVPAMLAFFAVIGSVVTAVLAYKTSKKSDEIINKTNVIEHSTNSHLTKLTAEIELIRAEFKSLKESSAKEVQTLEATIARQHDDKKTADNVAAKVAETAQKPAAPPLGTQRTITDASVSLKEDIVIEGTLETKK